MGCWWRNRCVGDFLNELNRSPTSQTLSPTSMLTFSIHFKPTVVSLTHHPYFNLNGHRSWSTVDDLHLTVQTTKYLDTDEENVPTGQINDGTGTFMDLSTGRYITQVKILL